MLHVSLCFIERARGAHLETPGVCVCVCVCVCVSAFKRLRESDLADATLCLVAGLSLVTVRDFCLQQPHLVS